MFFVGSAKRIRDARIDQPASAVNPDDDGWQKNSAQGVPGARRRERQRQAFYPGFFIRFLAKIRPKPGKTGGESTPLKREKGDKASPANPGPHPSRNPCAASCKHQVGKPSNRAPLAGKRLGCKEKIGDFPPECVAGLELPFCGKPEQRFRMTSRCVAENAAPAHADASVILVHGLKDRATKMARLARYLEEAEGRRTHCCELTPNWGEKGLECLAEQLRAFVEERVPGGERCDLVGFSMGGLVGRYYLQRLGGLERVRRFVTLATPHRGSLLAWLFRTPGIRQMRPGSDFLEDLNGDAARLTAVGFTSLWTPFDTMVLPASRSVLPAARCRRLWCLAHPLMVWQRHCHRAVAEALAG